MTAVDVRALPRTTLVADAAVDRSVALRAVCLVATLVGIATACHFFALRGSLWEDELIALTHTQQPLPSFFIEVLRNDIHPPLYFLQLMGWMALGPASDGWALANSLAWAAVSLLTIFVVADRCHGRRAAWLALALFAVLPNFAWSAGTLRMYAAVPAWIVFAYFANRRWFETRDWRWLATVAVVEILVACTHAVEFFFIAFVVLGALLEAAAAGRVRLPTLRFRQSVRMWLIVQVVFGFCVLPLAASALVRGSDASAPDSLFATLTVGGALISGWKTSGLLPVRLAGTLIFAVLVVAAVVERDSRWRTLGIPIAALLVALVLGMAAKPIFKQPVFAANLLPFVVLGAAAAASRSTTWRALVVAATVVLAAGAWPLAARQAPSEAYAAAARSVRDRAVAGDVVVVPNVSVFWGIVRYAVGPDWGRPLAVMPVPNAEWARLNARIASLLGADAPRRLGLVPDRDFVDANGVRYVLGSDVVAATRDAPHVWVVTRERYRVDLRMDPALHPSEAVPLETFGDGELAVSRRDRGAAP